MRFPRCRPVATLVVPAVVAAATAGCGDSAPSPGIGPSEPVTTTTIPMPAPTSPADAVRTPVAPATPAAPAVASLAPPYIAAAEWDETPYGATLRVTPTENGRRTDGAADENEAWSEILALAPTADTPTMHDQFDCHWTWARVVAPDKPTWNLEPWRPVVSAGEMILTKCNPGGPEV